MSVSASSKLEDESALAVVARGMRVLIYSASFFKIDGVTMTLRGLIDHIVTRGGRVLVLTADRPSDEAVDEFCGKRDAIEVLQATGGLVPVPGADYFMGLHVNEKTKRALECFDPGVVHITNPDLVTLWVRALLCFLLDESSYVQCGHTRINKQLFHRYRWAPARVAERWLR